MPKYRERPVEPEVVDAICMADVTPEEALKFVEDTKTPTEEMPYEAWIGKQTGVMWLDSDNGTDFVPRDGWVVRAGNSLKVYTAQEFREQFEPMERSDDG